MNDSIKDAGEFHLGEETYDLKHRSDPELMVIEMEGCGIGLVQHRETGEVAGAVLSVIGKKQTGTEEDLRDTVIHITVNSPGQAVRVGLTSFGYLLTKDQLDVIESLAMTFFKENVSKNEPTLVESMMVPEVADKLSEVSSHIFNMEKTTEGPDPE